MASTSGSSDEKPAPQGKQQGGWGFRVWVWGLGLGFGFWVLGLRHICNAAPPSASSATASSPSGCALPSCMYLHSHVTRHTSHITRHTSHVTRHASHVTRHTSHTGAAASPNCGAPAPAARPRQPRTPVVRVRHVHVRVCVTCVCVMCMCACVSRVCASCVCVRTNTCVACVYTRPPPHTHLLRHQAQGERSTPMAAVALEALLNPFPALAVLTKPAL